MSTSDYLSKWLYIFYACSASTLFVLQQTQSCPTQGSCYPCNSSIEFSDANSTYSTVQSLRENQKLKLGNSILTSKQNYNSFLGATFAYYSQAFSIKSVELPGAKKHRDLKKKVPDYESYLYKAILDFGQTQNANSFFQNDYINLFIANNPSKCSFSPLCNQIT